MKHLSLLAGILCALILVVIGLWVRSAPGPAPFAPVELVTVPAGRIDYRPFGNFTHGGKAQTPRAEPVEVAGFEIMKFQVSRAQYAACVAAGSCPAVPATGGEMPQTMVNWQDASAFAAWYSKVTGQHWRLPTDRECQLAAAERYGEASADPGDLDPGERMLAQYKAGVLLRGTASPVLRPAGGFGLNSRGLADMSGNIWEWTDGCMESGTLAEDGAILASEPYCWVRIAGGRHRRRWWISCAMPTSAAVPWDCRPITSASGWCARLPPAWAASSKTWKQPGTMRCRAVSMPGQEAWL